MGVRSLLGCGDAIAFWGCGGAIVFGMWVCDRFWDVGSAIAVLGCGDAIA